MPSRKRVKRIDSTPVQGSDSYVDIRLMTNHEAKEFRKAWTDLFDEYGIARNANADQAAAENPEFAAAMESFMSEHMMQFVEGWNWVDDEGKALPAPSTKGIMEQLLQSEIAFLSSAFSQAVQPDDAQKKK